jgi:hypothetical protein
VKRTFFLIIIGVVIGGGAVWMKMRSSDAKPAGEQPAAEKPAGDEADKTSITLDADGNVVIGMSDEMQGDVGIVVTNPVAAQLAPEVKGYGRVLDPAPLAALMTELASAGAAFTASSNELARLKTLEGQGNASARALQSAEAAAQHDQLAVQSVKERLVLSWGQTLANKSDLPAFIQSLAALETVLVRIDLPASEVLELRPTGSRIVTLSGNSAEAEFLGAASGVDPQIQGRGFIFLIKSDALHLLSGEAVTGHLKIPGEPLAGAIIPRDAVVRTGGKGWVYVLNENGESFTRKEIALDHPTETGWFVTNSVTAGNHVVVTGAQTLLSEELKASIKPD